MITQHGRLGQRHGRTGTIGLASRLHGNSRRRRSGDRNRRVSTSSSSSTLDTGRYGLAVGLEAGLGGGLGGSKDEVDLVRFSEALDAA
jgi:hypothetical protein